MNSFTPTWQRVTWILVVLFLLGWGLTALPNLGRLQRAGAASDTFKAIEPHLRTERFSGVYANIGVGQVGLHGTVPTEADLIALTNLVVQNTPKNGVRCMVKVRVADAVSSPAR